MKHIFLEVVHQALYSGKVWVNRFFLFCIRLVGPYSKPFLSMLLVWFPNDILQKCGMEWTTKTWIFG